MTSGALQLLLSERPPLGTTSGFILDSSGSPPRFLPFCPGHLAASLRAAPCSWLCVWESSEHQSSETAAVLIFTTINPSAHREELTAPLATQSVCFSAWETGSLC